jgi:hypothetical protein
MYVFIGVTSLSFGVFVLPEFGFGWTTAGSLVWAAVAGFLAAGVMRFLRKSGRLYRRD